MIGNLTKNIFFLNKSTIYWLNYKAERWATIYLMLSGTDSLVLVRQLQLRDIGSGCEHRQDENREVSFLLHLLNEYDMAGTFMYFLQDL